MTDTSMIQIEERNTFLDDQSSVVWRGGKKPRYTETDRVLRTQSQMDHPKGSLEYIVQNLVRAFELEATYKLKPEQWKSIVLDEFVMITNNGNEFSAYDIVNQGTYNLFLGDSPQYRASEESFQSSHKLFKSTFPTGFVWEVMEVYSEAPKISFKWRHWGKFEGNYREHKASGKVVEIIGLSVAHVTDELKIRRIEHYFDTSDFLGDLTAESKCPMAKKEKSQA